MSFYCKQLRVTLIKTEDVVSVVLELEGNEGFADEVRFDALLMAVLEIRFAD